MFRSVFMVSVLVASLMFSYAFVSNAYGMTYLVKGSSGPVSLLTGEMAQLLENVVILSLDQLAKMEKEGKVTGGLPVGQRALVFVVEASSNQELDQMLRSLPIWGRDEVESDPTSEL